MYLNRMAKPQIIIQNLEQIKTIYGDGEKRKIHMSTRAIIAIQNQDGTYTGAWCWNNGYDILDYLKKYFHSKELANEIANSGHFSFIYTKDEAKKWDQEKIKNHWTHNKKWTILSNNIYLEKECHNETKSESYKNLNELTSQDINVAYVFNKRTNEWEIWDWSNDLKIAQRLTKNKSY